MHPLQGAREGHVPPCAGSAVLPCSAGPGRLLLLLLDACHILLCLLIDRAGPQLGKMGPGEEGESHQRMSCG